MNQTPEDPHPPYEPGDTPPTEPVDSPAPDDAITLTPLDEAPTRRRFPSVGRLVAVTVVVLALVGGAAAFALGGNDEDPLDEGVASIDGTEGEVDDDDGSSGNGGSPPQDDSEIFDAMLKFAECMREHGIDMPDPEMGEGGVQMKGGVSREGGPPDEEKFEAAQKECEHFMEDARANMPKPSPEERAEMQDKMVAMAECMRARGYDMPDPEVAEDGGVKMRVSRGGPQDDPGGDDQFEKDQEECNAEAGLDDDGPARTKGES